VPGVDGRLDLPYARRDGRDLLLDLFIPTGAGPFAGVIVVHGGAWKSGDRAMERPLARQLAARGFVTATVGYRLGPDGRFPNALFDLKAAVRWLRSNAGAYRLSAARIGAVGVSAGGQLVALAGATNGDPAYEDAPTPAAAGSEGVSSDLAAVVDIDGLADFTGADLLAKEDRRAGAPTQFLGGGFAARAETWRAASALLHVGPKSAPTLFINSAGPSPIPSPILPGRTEMCDRLRALGIDSEIVVFPGTPHPFWLVNPWFTPTVDAAARFLHRHL
jgi:pectinesterase